MADEAGAAAAAGPAPAPVWPPPEEEMEMPKEDEEEEEIWLTAVSPDDFPNEDTCKTFIFREEGHTFGNALRYMISHYPDVKYCAYTLPHPAEKVMHLRIQTVPGILPQDVLARGLNDLHDLSKIMLEKFETEMAKCPPPEDAPVPDLPIEKFGPEEDTEPAKARAKDKFTSVSDTFGSGGSVSSPVGSPTKQATFSLFMRSADSSPTTSPPKPGPSGSGAVAKTPEEVEKEVQAMREEQIAHQDSVREEIRLKNLKKRKAQEDKVAEDVAAALEKIEREKRELEDAEVLRRYKLQYPDDDIEEEEEEEQPPSPPPPKSDSEPESEPELVDLGDSD